jgi:uncharacterized protein
MQTKLERKARQRRLSCGNSKQTSQTAGGRKMKNQKMTPTEVVREVLKDPINEEHVKPYIGPGFKYVSLNYKNDDLKKVLPWAGTHEGEGYRALTDTFKGVSAHWSVDKFEPEAAFDDGENVAIFGSFTLTSKTLRKTRTSPFAIFAKVKDDKLTYFQYMEDTHATMDTFRKGGKAIYKTTPNGADVEI